MKILDDLLSKDPHKIWSASGKIRHLRDNDKLTLLASELTNIEKATNGINLGASDFHLTCALNKLNLIKNNGKTRNEEHLCFCELYPKDIFYNPIEEEASGYIEITEILKISWNEKYKCTCIICKNNFNVKRQEYHYTWYEWIKENSN